MVRIMEIEPTKYRNRPVVIEAMQWDGKAESVPRILEWIKQWGPDVGSPPEYYPAHKTSSGQKIRAEIRTYGYGVGANAHAGDFIIRGLPGHFYKCKPDIFEAAYKKEDEINFLIGMDYFAETRPGGHFDEWDN
jgi:hypothetical protein